MRRMAPDVWSSQPTHLTNAQVLELKNGLDDLREVVAQLLDEQAEQNSVLEHHDAALTKIDDTLHAQVQVIRFGRNPQPPAPVRTIADAAIDPDFTLRGEAWEHMVFGMTTYVRQGVTGAELIDVIDALAGELYRRHGLDAKLEGIRL
jgi:hypothetical protein